MDQAPEQNAAPETEAPAMQPAAPAEAPKAPAYGSLLGIILIVAVLVIGAFYIWGERLESDQQVPEGGVRGDTLPLEGGASADVEVEGEEPQPL